VEGTDRDGAIGKSSPGHAVRPCNSGGGTWDCSKPTGSASCGRRRVSSHWLRRSLVDGSIDIPKARQEPPHRFGRAYPVPRGIWEQQPVHSGNGVGRTSRLPNVRKLVFCARIPKGIVRRNRRREQRIAESPPGIDFGPE